MRILPGGKVRCVDCGLLQESRPTGQAPTPRMRVPSADMGVGPSERAAIVAGTFDWRLGQLSCHVGAADYRATVGPREPGRRWTAEQLAQIAAQVTRPRQCPHFCRLKPGNSPEKHLELRRAARKTRSDRTWDVVKIGIGFVLGVAATLIGAAVKGS